MNQNPWFRYALFSFLGALMLMFVSGLVQGGGFGMQAGMMPINNMNMQAMSMQGMLMQSIPMNGMMPITAGPMVMNGSVPVSSLAVYPLPGGGMTIMPMGSMIGMANGMMNSGYIAMNNVSTMGVMSMGNVPMNGVMSGMPMNMGGMVSRVPLGAMGFNSLPMGGM